MRGRYHLMSHTRPQRATLLPVSGRLDILVNNAGVNRPQPFLEVDEPPLDQLLGLNVRAAFIVTQAAARLMVAL